jgi:hypothetical protein
VWVALTCIVSISLITIPCICPINCLIWSAITRLAYSYLSFSDRKGVFSVCGVASPRQKPVLEHRIFAGISPWLCCASHLLNSSTPKNVILKPYTSIGPGEHEFRQTVVPRTSPNGKHLTPGADVNAKLKAGQVWPIQHRAGMATYKL